MKSRTRGASVWGVFALLAAVFGGMVLAMLFGTGVFRNWGKRSEAEEADRILYEATGALLAGNLADRSTQFPPHAAGKSSREMYLVLRSDAADSPKVEQAYAVLQTLASRHGEPKTGLRQATQAVTELKSLLEERKQRAARMVLRLKSWAAGSDRLTRQYRKIAQAFEDDSASERDPRDKRAPPDESDNLFGGPNRILGLKIEFGEGVCALYTLLSRNPDSFKVVSGRAVAQEPKGEFAEALDTVTSKLDRVENLVGFYQRRLDSAVEAERRGLKRSLGL